MKVWIDAQLPPTLANWLTQTFTIEAASLRDLGLRDARDIDIFEAARAAQDIVIITKDSDFVDLVCRLGVPPQIIWLTCGNVTNRNLRNLLTTTFPLAIEQLQRGESIVEIGS
jgi:predicted nuclease of predicted toxin-antitoxin system